MPSIDPITVPVRFSWDTSERPTSKSPRRVRAAEARRLALAAGFTVGKSVLDVGAGNMTLYDLVCPWVKTYTALDHALPMHEGSNIEMLQGDIPGELALLDRVWDTVVCLETLEHIDPAHQAKVVQDLWAATRRRLIISGPDPDALLHYPRTDHFLSHNNPNHLREVDEWWLRDQIASLKGVRGVQVFNQGLDKNDWPVWLGGPTAYWMAVIDRG